MSCIVMTESKALHDPGGSNRRIHPLGLGSSPLDAADMESRLNSQSWNTFQSSPAKPALHIQAVSQFANYIEWKISPSQIIVC